ncbi:MAG TPA: MFS transporter [Vicinamibacterales bacterium]|nr:MFS transporter [Vicinamibacterales bacterium]
MLHPTGNLPDRKTEPAVRMLALVALSQFLGMTLWFSATAAAPRIAADLGLGSIQVAWLTIAVQGGFVGGTLVSAILNLADVFNARRLFAFGCAVGAVANASVIWTTDPFVIFALRFVTGVALACVYPPGMKIAAGWFKERRGTALGVLVGALSLGSAFPHLLSFTASAVSWHSLMLTSSALALVGGAIVWLAVDDGPHVTASAPFDPHAIGAVVRNRGARLATFGYLGHMWELYAMWAWISAFATASLLDAGVPPQRTGSLIAFVAIASGALGCVAAGVWADRWGKARIAGGALAVSSACSALAGFLFGAPVWALLLLSIIWGFSVVADSAQFSALVTEHSPRTHVGTALTLQTSAGFLLTMVSMQLLPLAAARYGWQWVFLLLVPGPVLGAWAMQRLRLTSPA